MGILTFKDKKFYMDGEEFVVISGAMHYFRIPREYWHDRLLKLRECGFNCVETYTCWNLHERREGEFDFSGMLDIVEYVKEAERVGLYVILRPGPYICAEWEFGGLPSWLLNYDDMELRCNDPVYLSKVRRYYDELLERLRPHFAVNGGNIIMLQVENEYGSYGDDKDYLRAILNIYKEKGIDAKGYFCDVTDEEQVKQMVADIEKDLGTIDILVNNAGIIKRIPMIEMSAEDFRQVVDIDLNAPFIVSKAVIPGMIKKGHGKIINICSMMSELGRETVSAYAAAKGGLKMLTRNICSEYGEYNIQCNGIGPGYIATPQTAPLREPQADGSRHPFDQFIIAKTPAARWGEAEDLMGPAVFLASDASNFVNGHVLYVDGGILAYIGKQP